MPGNTFCDGIYFPISCFLKLTLNFVLGMRSKNPSRYGAIKILLCRKTVNAEYLVLHRQRTICFDYLFLCSLGVFFWGGGGVFCFVLTSRLRIGDVAVSSKFWAMFGAYSLEQWGIFIVSRLWWHGTSVYKGPSKWSVHYGQALELAKD